MNERFAYGSHTRKLQQNKEYAKMCYQKNKAEILEYKRQYDLRKNNEKSQLQNQSQEQIK